MSIGIIGKKVGMTRIYDAGGQADALSPSSPPETTSSLQRKTVENDGYAAVQVGFDTQKKQRVTKAELGHFEKAGAEPKKDRARVPPQGRRGRRRRR